MAAKKVSRTLGWILMALVMVGLVGFGATNFGNRGGAIGTVGDTEVDANRYFRELNGELRAYEAATGQRMTMAQARAAGLDQQVLARLIATVALENEVARLGLSVGDAKVREQLLATRELQNPDGSFNRPGYDMLLQQMGVSAKEFEDSLRIDTARTILQMAAQNGITPQPAYTDTLYAHAREERSFTWTRLDLSALKAPVPAPTDEQLTAWYEANPAPFTLPETKHLTYVWLDPETVIPTIEVDETTLRALYDERAAEYQTPERRLVERLVFGSQDEAQAAADRLASGEIDFAALVAERGLDLSDTDMGDVTRTELGAAGDAVFALTETGSVAGPLDSTLGPALFRMNAVLPAQITSFEQARETLQGEVAADTARRQIDAMVPEMDELLAGGATLEELQADYGMTLATMDWTASTQEGIAAYESFRKAAAQVTTSDFPQIVLMSDGGLFALRADKIDASRVQALDEARQIAVEGWSAQEALRLLTVQAEALKTRFEAGETPVSLGMTEVVEEARTRDEVVDGAPRNLVSTVFDMAPDSWRVLPATEGVIIAHLDAVIAADQDAQNAVTVKQAFNQRLAQELGLDIEIALAAALQAEAGVTLNRQVINAVNAQFP